jgi:hypothetical protein
MCRRERGSVLLVIFGTALASHKRYEIWGDSDSDTGLISETVALEFIRGANLLDPSGWACKNNK